MHYEKQSEAIKKQSTAYQLTRTATFIRGSMITRQEFPQRERNKMVMPVPMANLLMDCICALYKIMRESFGSLFFITKLKDGWQVSRVGYSSMASKA